MTRYMYDAIHANAHTLVGVVQPNDLIAIYLTGTPNIRWTTADVELFPEVKTWVRIDQGGLTSPQHGANVVDVEPGAWSAANADAQITKFRSPQTIYVNRSQLHTVSAKVPIWLAAPGLSDAQAIALAKMDCRIVAVQNVWASTYDRSIVVSDTWMSPDPPSGLPTGITYSEFATQSQINCKCDPVDPSNSAHNQYEWQLERLTIHGWELITTVKTTSVYCSFKNLEPKQHYRFRVTRGTWSGWVNVAT